MNGYAITSADKRVPEVMCITERGALADTTFNVGLKMFMEGMRAYIDSVRYSISNIDSLRESARNKLKSVKSTTKAIPTISEENGWTYIGWINVDNLVLKEEKTIPVKWGQGYPYNDALPIIENKIIEYIKR